MDALLLVRKEDN
jgi:uncharacterized Zn-finger protein